MEPKQLATLSDHVATIRQFADDVHSIGLDSQDRIDYHMGLIKVECFILKKHLEDMMPFLTDEVIT